MSTKAVAKSVRSATRKNIKQATQPCQIYSRILHELYLRAFETVNPIALANYKSDSSIMYLSSKSFMQDAQIASKVGLTDPFPITASRTIIAFLENIHSKIISEGINGNICSLVKELREPSLPVLTRVNYDTDDDHRHAIKTLLCTNLKSSDQLRDIAAKLLNMIKLLIEPLLYCMLICKRVPSTKFLAAICYSAGYPDEIIQLAEIPITKKKSKSGSKSRVKGKEKNKVNEADDVDEADDAGDADEADEADVADENKSTSKSAPAIADASGDTDAEKTTSDEVSDDEL